MTDVHDEVRKNLEALKAEEHHVPTEEVVVEEKHLTDFEAKMVKKGWDPNGKKSAEEWLDAGFDIRGKNVKSLNSTVEYLKNYVERQEKEAYERALNDLKAQRREAIELADVRRVEELDNQQAQLQDTSTKSLVDNFHEKHADWLKGTSYQAMKMAEACHKKDQEMMARGLPPEKHLEALENFMMGEFPDYFSTNVKEDVAPVVEGRQESTVRSSNKRSFGFSDLSDLQKKIGKNLVDKKVMTMDAYIADLVKQGDLK